MATSRIHLVNPKANSFTTRPMFLNRALYSPLAGLRPRCGTYNHPRRPRIDSSVRAWQVRTRSGTL
jgi:hypothetical protein